MAHLNRLIHETSPYLRQHAHNPVDWYPWCHEALELARTLDRPIFLSIGYSACHWCHVMERESFENPEIAALMNEWFVNIKVDREERPDLDQIYMNAVMAYSGSGGWPMSVFLTPDGKPFCGGTYWPPTSRWGRPGFRDVLTAVHNAWTSQREALGQQAEELTQSVVAAGSPSNDELELSLDTLRHAERSLLQVADRQHGGFGRAPKFPHPMDLRVLLRCSARFGHSEALNIATLTLDKMACGGIYDQLGGGFARYSTDERWLAPHFEKMLYDNALLATAYLEAYQATGNTEYARVVRETLDYVLREMTQPQGGFYSTQDADSEGVEGKYFVWSAAEVLQILGPDDGRAFALCYDVTPEGNWEGRNILHRQHTTAQAAQALHCDAAELEERLRHCREKLFAARSQRVPPARDDKVLTSWNGLMIAAMAQAANVLADPRYAEAACRAVDFILSAMRTEDGRLWHAFKDGRARFNGYLDDYAALIDGLTELVQVGGAAEIARGRYLQAAVQLADRMVQQFWDATDGGFFYTSADHESLISRNKDTHDNATPSGNSLAALALVKLARLADRPDFEDLAHATVRRMSGTLTRMPMAAGQALLALDFLLGPSPEVVFCPGASDAESNALWLSLHRRFVPNKLTLYAAAASENHATIPLLAGKSSVRGEPAAYVCERGACRAPVHGCEAVQETWERLPG